MRLPDDHPLSVRDERLYIEDVCLADLATTTGTPSYVYSRAYIAAAYARLSTAFQGVPHRLHYAVKANSNLAILDLLKDLGAGFDIVSGGELTRVLAVGGDPASVVFSGVGKTVEEIDYALKAGVGCFNVESAGELDRIALRAALLERTAPVSLRVNPNVDAQTHPYISTGLKDNKFGVPIDAALDLYAQATEDEWLDVRGIDCHIGSQIASIEPLLESLTSLLQLVDELAERGVALDHIDLGGGMGVTYRNEPGLDVETYGAQVTALMGDRPQRILLEPGRFLTANAGVLLTRVEYLKPGTGDAPNFAVVDAAMNDLIRPALYEAYHDVLTIAPAAAAPTAWQVVGPVCESGDWLARDRSLALDEESVLAIASAGAYGMVQASNYNSRGRAAEVLVDGAAFAIVRRRETIQDQLRLERPYLTDDEGDADG